MGHAPEDYGDGADEHGVPPGTYQALERHLPRRLRAAPRDRKLAVMRRILQGLYPLRDVDMVRNTHAASASKFLFVLQPLYREIYNMNPSTFFVPSFLQAIRSNNEAGFRSIMAEPAPGLFVFSMLQPAFCQMLKAEVDHFQHHLRYARNQRMMVTTTIGENKYGVDLSDFGLETKLDNLLKDFLSPIATGFHIDDSEVTLNVCINEEYIGGDMYFCGVRCMNHINSSEPRNQVFGVFHITYIHM
ncbi:hypothetical protein HU200_055770 [Digitaria exilis]|uniref:Uncharacterized protein n=1 Tax=Digitaria exilis TaxID=1010633 RepID=A0A835AFG7_9POAL|nr:hypothetical protein HU200_055770 [Digitaria exilis]